MIGCVLRDLWFRHLPRYAAEPNWVEDRDAFARYGKDARERAEQSGERATRATPLPPLLKIHD